MAKIKKAQSGYSATAKRVDSLRAAGAKQIGTPAAGATLKRLKAAEAQEKKEDSIKMKPSKIKMMMGGKVSKAQKGKTMPPVTVKATTMNRGSKSVQTSPGGAYKMKTTTNAAGDTTRQVERRTVQGLLKGAPKARGVMKQTFKSGGKMKKK